MNACRRSSYPLARVVILIVAAVVASPIPRAVAATLPDCTWEDGPRPNADEIAVAYGFGMDKLLEYAADHAKSGTSAAGKYASFLAKSNVILAYAKLFMSYYTLDVTIRMEGPGPLVRHKDRSSGETRQLTATVTQNTGDLQFVNCLRIAANNAGLDFDLPQDGRREDVGVEWDLVSGGTKVATKEDYAIIPEIVYLEKGDTTHALTSKTDDKGEAHIMVSGAARKDALPEPAVPVDKEFKVRVNIQLEPPRIRKSIDTGLGGAAGGPAALLTFVPEMLYAARWFSSATYTFPVTDWEPCAEGWVGTIEVTSWRETSSSTRTGDAKVKSVSDTNHSQLFRQSTFVLHGGVTKIGPGAQIQIPAAVVSRFEDNNFHVRDVNWGVLCSPKNNTWGAKARHEVEISSEIGDCSKTVQAHLYSDSKGGYSISSEAPEFPTTIEFRSHSKENEIECQPGHDVNKADSTKGLNYGPNIEINGQFDPKRPGVAAGAMTTEDPTWGTVVVKWSLRRCN
jgi:hypothetical protein